MISPEYADNFIKGDFLVMEIKCKICSCRLSNLDTQKIRVPLDGYVYRICNTCVEHLKRFTAYEFINTGHGRRIERRYEDENNC